MKKLFVLAVLSLMSAFSSVSVFARETVLTQCRLVQVIDSSYFEEALSVEEYPNLQVTTSERGMSISIGAWTDWRESNGDVIRSLYARGAQAYYFQYRGEAEGFTLSIRPGQNGRRYGQLSVSSPAVGNRLIANFLCR